jgi:hypothetical protein
MEQPTQETRQLLNLNQAPGNISQSSTPNSQHLDSNITVEEVVAIHTPPQLGVDSYLEEMIPGTV